MKNFITLESRIATAGHGHHAGGLGKRDDAAMPFIRDGLGSQPKGTGASR